jgi:hypothetical protein
MLIEILFSTIIAQANVDDVLKELERQGFTVENDPVTITIEVNEDGTTTITGPSNDGERLGALHKTIQEKHQEYMDRNTRALELYNSYDFLEHPESVPEEKLIEFDSLRAENLKLKEEIIKPLQVEYNALLKRIHSETTPLIEKDNDLP